MDNSTDIISMLRYLEHLRLLIDHMQCEQPYRLNVIDELHINENGHSRILAKLLQYRAADGIYVFLESLLHYINAKKKTNFPNKVVKPDITQEEERIDLWVRDKDFALIFENKACGAFDQDTQLFRYIKRSEDHGYKDEPIFASNCRTLIPSKSRNFFNLSFIFPQKSILFEFFPQKIL